MGALGACVAAVTLLLGCASGGEPSRVAMADTVFAEDFETGDLGLWQDGVNPALHRIVHDSGGAQSGRRYLEATYPAAADGGWLTRFFLPGYDSLYVSLWVRFPNSWSGDTKLVALYGSRTDNQWSALGQAGKCPAGDDFFATMLVADWTTTPGAGRVRFYTYYPEMAREPNGVTCWGRFGDGTERYDSTSLRPGVWNHIEFVVTLNAPGAANASQRFWVNGMPGGTWSTLSLRRSSILRLNALQLTFSRTVTGATRQQVFIDHIVVGKRRPI